MTEIAYFKYESNAPIETADKYFLQLKGHVEYKGGNDSVLQSTINSSSISFFKSLQLFDALQLLENSECELNQNYHNSVINDCSESQLEVRKFVLTTIDAVQSVKQQDPVNVEINPELEAKKKNKGLLGKLFGKN